MRWRCPAERRCALGTELRLISLREAHDHLVHAGGLRRLDHACRIPLSGQPRDVLFYRCIQERYFLRKVADVSTEALLRCHCASSASSRRTLPRSTGQIPVNAPNQRGLPATAGPNNPERIAGPELKPDFAQENAPELGAATVIFSTLKVDFGAGSSMRLLSFGKCNHGLAQPLEWQFAPLQHPSSSDSKIDQGQRP